MKLNIMSMVNDDTIVRRREAIEHGGGSQPVPAFNRPMNNLSQNVPRKRISTAAKNQDTD